MKLRRSRQDDLVLLVTVVRATGLVPGPNTRCNPVCVISVPEVSTAKTAKLHGTVTPEWNETVSLKISRGKRTGSAFCVTIWDKQRLKREYLGELRLNLVEVLEYAINETERKFKLYSSRSRQKYVMGKVTLKFSLSKGKRPTNESSDSLAYSMSPDIKSEVADISAYLTSTEPPSLRHIIEVDEQGFYPEDWRFTVPDTEAKEPDLLEVPKASESDLSDFTDTDSSSLPIPQGMAPVIVEKKAIRSYRLHARKDIKGILVLEIVSASGLPPYRSFTRTGFDMDPFVVISFGKRVYRTSWRKHTLSPQFNEKLAIEVLNSELGYDMQFSVLDKDHFSFNDQVATGMVTVSDLMQSEPEEMRLALTLDGTKQARVMQEYKPILVIRFKFESYKKLRKELFYVLLLQYEPNEDNKLDAIELAHFLDNLGSTLADDTLESFFESYGLNPWVGEKLTFDQIVEQLENFLEKKEDGGESEEEIITIEQCPACGRARLSDKQDVDIVTHIALCGSKDWSSVEKVLKPSFGTVSSASRRWYSKMLIKLTYGTYGLGQNNANILVQDRDTGIVIEEKMSVYVRLGIRLLYQSFDRRASRWKEVRKLLRHMSIKQGAKYDDPQSKSQISSFIKFHNLDMSQCLLSVEEFSTFNEFFYRKLKPGARPIEGDENVAVSSADCRFTAFDTILLATSIWIKGRDFTVPKLFGGHYEQLASTYEHGSLCIFRLAPQDYHRFHCPVDGVVGKPVYIEGEYFTVNPMAIRSELDVYGENVRVLLPIYSKKFGTVMMVCVGAMMVGSTVLTVKEGDSVKRGDEAGYFKFGGSTVVLLFQPSMIKFDADLTDNSSKAVESLIKMGTSIGHTPETPEFQREHRKFEEQSEERQLQIIKCITGGDGVYRGMSWEAQNLNLST